LVVCLSNVLAARFGHGGPRQQLFDAKFDPTTALASHLSGASGHCVSRSGIIATALLATGVPARVVQLVWSPAEGAPAGHNALEFLDPEKGWTFFDPTFAGYFENASGSRSAAAIAFSGKAAIWRVAGVAPAGLETLPTPADSAFLSPKAVAFLSYVEPWLYTRVGKPVAPRPFNARFVMAGPAASSMVLSHWALRGAILVTALGLAGCLVVAVRVRSRARRSLRGEDRESLPEEEAIAMRVG
jgi:hypothetical protein